MKILFNPIEPEGATIKNIYYKDELFFSSEDNDAFLPGTVREFQDGEIFIFFKDLYGFLREVDITEAKKYLERSKETLTCDKCDFRTSFPIALAGHKRRHESEKEISDLGLPVVRSKQAANRESKTEQEKIEEQTKQDGLEGEGLQVENFGVGTVMS